MARWSLDTARFAEEVFLPVRGGWEPRRNLFRYFQLPLDVDDPRVIEQAVQGVDAHVKQNSLAGVHSGTAGTLRELHPAAAATIRDPDSRTRHRDEVMAARATLVDAVRAELGGLPALPEADVARLTAGFAGRFVRREVEEAFTLAGATVRAPVELDSGPAPTGWTDVQLALRGLGLTTLGDYLRSRPALGVAPTADGVTRTREQLDRTAAGAALTNEERILVAVERWRAQGNLNAVLRREAIDTLMADAALGPALLASLRTPRFATYARQIGLPEPDELGYALLYRARFSDRRPTGWLSLYEAARAARDLRSAHEVLCGQRNLAPDLVRTRDELASRLAEVDALLTRALELEGADPERAAELYVQVGRTCRDPEAEAGLRRCRPAPPARATARLDDPVVRVEWEPTTARAGEISYRVVRGRAPGDGLEVATTSELSVTDPSAPGGVPLIYHVSTLRNAEPSAGVATTPPLTVLRAVVDLECVPGDEVVDLRWRLPSDAVGVRILRTDGGGAAAATVFRRPGTLFRDTEVRSGVRYEYRVEAEYATPDGEPIFASARLARARPQKPPQPVTDLAVVPEPDGDGAPESMPLRWKPPPFGEVRLRLSNDPVVAVGAVLPLSAADRIGSALELRDQATPGSARIAVPPDGRRYWLVPLTVAEDVAVVGTPVEHDRRLPAVEGFSAAAQGARVRLTWKWPGQAGEVRVWESVGTPRTDPAAAATGRKVSHATYRQAGCHFPARPGEQRFTVCVRAFIDGVEVFGPTSHARSMTAAEVLFEIERISGWRNRNRRRFRFVPDVDPPPAVEIRAKVSIPPLGPADGTRIARIPSEDGSAATPPEEFELTLTGRPLHLRAYPLDPDVAVVLVAANPAQLRID